MGGGGTTFIAPDGFRRRQEASITVTYYIAPDAHYEAGPQGLVANVSVYQSDGVGHIEPLADMAFDLNTKFAPQAEIELDKILLNNRVAPGGRALFEVTVRNNGPSDVHGLKLDDSTNPNLGAPTLPDEAMNGFDLPANSGRTFIVSAKVKDATSSGDLIRNEVTLDTSGVIDGVDSDPFYIDHNGPVGAQGRVGDLLPDTDVEVVSKTCDPVVPGNINPFRCEIVIRNNGNADAQGVTVSDHFESMTAFVEDSPDFTTTQGNLPFNLTGSELYTCSSANGFSCVRRAPMPAGVEDTITIGFGAPANAHLIANDRPENYVSVTALNPDSDYHNNDIEIALDLEPTVRLGIRKRALQSQVQPGGTALFEISIRNKGPSDIAGLRLDDVCSGAVVNSDPVYITPFATRSQGLYVPGAGNATNAAGVVMVLASCQASDDAIPGSDRVVNRVSFDLSRLIKGESTLPHSGYRITYDNGGDAARARVDVSDFLPEVDLYVRKTPNRQRVTSGDPINWLITVGNAGPGTAENVVLRDRADLFFGHKLENFEILAVPDPLFDAHGQPRTCLAGIDGIQCQLGAVGPGEEISVGVSATAKRTPEACGFGVNIAIVGADNPELFPHNNFDLFNGYRVDCDVNLTVDKTVLNDNICLDSYGLYEVTVTNNGPTDAERVLVRDELPLGLTYAGNSPGCFLNGVGPNGGDRVRCNVNGDLAVGESVTYLIGFNMITDPADPNFIADGDIVGPNTARAVARTSFAGRIGPFISNEVNFNAVFCALPPTDMDATTTIVPLNNAVAGEVYEFELYVENNGPNPAEGVTVHHLFTGLPSDWQLVAAPAVGPNWQCDGQGMTCTRQNPMPIGRELVATYRVLLPPDTGTEGNFGPIGDKIIGQALSVTADNPDPQLDNNRHVLRAPVSTESTLAIRKEALEPEIAAGGPAVAFKIYINNDGPSDAYDLVVADDPGALTLLSMSSSNTPMSCLFGACTIDVLPAGQETIIDVLIKAAPDLAPGDYVNTAEILGCRNDANNVCNLPDPASAEASIAVVGWADLKLQKFVKPDGVIQAGEPFTFTIFVDNLGVSAANNVVMNDTMFSSGAFDLLEVSDDRSACAIAPGSGDAGSPIAFSCQLTSLERYGRWTITAKVIANEEADVNNEARVTADDPQDPDMSNNSDTASMSVKGAADLSVEKVATTPSVNAGEIAEWTITVNNAGPSEAKNVQIRDILPAAIVVDTVSISPTNLACTIGSPGDPDDPTVCNLGNIPSGAAPVVVTISGQVDPAYKASPEIINDVTVASDTYDPNGGDNRDTANVGVVGAAELSIEKESQPRTVKAGEVVNYAITISNSGPSTAQNAKVTDALPTEMAYDSAEVVGGAGTECSYAPGPREVACVLGDLAPGVSKQVLIKVTVKPDTPPGDIVNEAAFSADGAATVTDQATTTVVVEVGLSATKRSSSLKPATGEVFYYTVEVTNYGPSVAKDVTVEDELTGSVGYLYSRGAECTKLNNGGDDQIECDLGDLAPDQTVTFDIVVEVKDWVREGHHSDNEILVKSTSSGVNGQPAQTTARSEDIVFRNLNDLMIRKFGKPDGKVDAGNKLVYTIIVDNFGPGYAYNTTVRDFLASDGTYSFQAPSFCSPASGTATGNQQLTCDLGTVEPGEQFIFTVEVTANEAQTVNNTGDVSAAGADVDPSNNDAIVEHEIDAVADLSITKVANSSSVAAGDMARFIITVHNDGPSTASNVTVMDMLPGGMTLVSADASQGVCSPDPIKCSLGNMSSGATAQITLRATVDANMAEGETLINSATVTSNAFDDDMSDNTANATVTVGADRKLHVVKSASTTAAVKAGTLVEFRIDVRNSGRSTVHNVIVKDDLPDALHFVSYAIVGDLGSCVDTLFDPEVVCALGSLVPDEERSIYIRVQVDPDAPQGVLTNVVMPDVLFDASSQLAASIRVERAAHIRVETQAMVSSVRPGDIFAYMVRVINEGPGTAASVMVDVDMPAILSYISDSIGCGPSLTDCSLGDIQPNDQREFQILVKLEESAVNVTEVMVSATASTSTQDATVDDSQGTAIVPVNGPEGVIYLPLITR
jgi:uncharacterized repeat protein (TIGR01451 family)